MLLLLLGCKSESLPIINTNSFPSQNLSPKTELPNKKILALGDSYTFGASVPTQDRWTNKLIDLTKNKFNFIEHTVIAKNGWTTKNLLDAIAQESPTASFDIITLLIGVNNQYQNLNFKLFETEFNQLVIRANSFAKDSQQRIIVLSIPDWGASPFGRSDSSPKISEDIDKYNSFIKQYCIKNNIPFINITSLTRQKQDDNYFAKDRLHYSATMHQLWAELALEEATKILQKQ